MGLENRPNWLKLPVKYRETTKTLKSLPVCAGLVIKHVITAKADDIDRTSSILKFDTKIIPVPD